jgi:hypothetical protein
MEARAAGTAEADPETAQFPEDLTEPDGRRALERRGPERRFGYAPQVHIGQGAQQAERRYNAKKQNRQYREPNRSAAGIAMWNQ